ncbi:peptidase [Mycolicibacterium goodii]|uniref:Peptidase n=1 Tax=Mycolicibacterium goodii TaxID=134601 RepID=A0A0K0X888_MYCGD|nr:peptidase [Mycolicibacterium goodii]
MRRSTTSAGTDPAADDPGGDRPASRVMSRIPAALLGLVLLIEFGLAVVLLRAAPGAPTAGQRPPQPAVSAPAAPSGPAAAPVQTVTLPDGRTARLMNLGGAQSGPLLDRIRGELPGAAEAVTAFWGQDWPREIEIAFTGSPEQFRVLGGVAADIAAITTADRIVFAPGAATMSPAALRIVLRHELFHYAARSVTAYDAPRWLTEGVADYVARPDAPRPGPRGADELAQLPTDADLDTPGVTRSTAYDRAWWFAKYVADAYGVAKLRDLYVRACGPDHPDIATAVRQSLGADLDEVVDRWRRWMSG